MTLIRSLASILLAAGVLTGVLLALSALPGMLLLPYYLLLMFFSSLWLAPVALILAIVHFFKKRQTGQGGSLMRIVSGYVAMMLGLGIFLTIWNLLQG